MRFWLQRGALRAAARRLQTVGIVPGGSFSSHFFNRGSLRLVARAPMALTTAAGKAVRMTGHLLIKYRFTTAMLILLGVWSAIAMVVAIPLAWSTGIPVGTLPFLSLISALGTLNRLVLQARSRFSALLLCRLVGVGVTGTWVLLRPPTTLLEGMVLVLTYQLLEAMLATLLARHWLQLSREGIREATLQMLEHGKWMLASRLGSSLHRTVDVWCIAWFLGPAAVGLYTAAWRVADQVRVPLIAVFRVMMPELARTPEHALDRSATLLWPLTVLAFLGGLLLALLAAPLLQLLAGEEYLAAARHPGGEPGRQSAQSDHAGGC